jgi:hypothetical protein
MLNTIRLEDALCIFESALLAFKILREQHQHESFVPMPSLLLQHHGGAKYCSMHIQNLSEIPQCSLKICAGAALFYHVGA